MYLTDGYGQNRELLRGSAIGQWEHSLGNGFLRLTATAFGDRYHTAGVLRQDDLRKGFYDTYDTGQGGSDQGGSDQRFSVAALIEQTSGNTLFSQQVFAIQSSMDLRENFTGFLL